MPANHYAFNVGDIACVSLLDGASTLTTERMLRRFPYGTEAEYRQAYADIGLSFDEADSSLNVLLARIGGETVLVDGGEGARPNGGRLLESLALAGITPQSITRIVITHTHGDHVQGLLTDTGQATFPNATYIISDAELAFWQQRIEAGGAAHAPILTMMQAAGLRQIALDAPILPGLTALPMPGHTPGQLGLRFESGDATLLHLADVIHSPMQFAHPDWSPGFDADTQVSVATRRAALARAADQRALTFFYHLTFPGLGHVARAGDGFTWTPIRETRL